MYWVDFNLFFSLTVKHQCFEIFYSIACYPVALAVYTMCSS